MAKTYEFELNMTCDGCANAAKKVLSKLGGDISDIYISIEAQRVVVTTTLPADTILSALQKTGRKCKQIFEDEPPKSLSEEGSE